MPGLGHQSYVQFGVKEASYGTYRVPTYKMELIKWDVEPVRGTIPDPSLYNARSRRDIYAGPFNAAGTFTFRGNYSGVLELYRAVMGGYTNTLVDGASRDHTFKETTTPLGTYTFEVSKGNVPSGKVVRYLGCKLLNMRLSVRAGAGADGMMTAEVTMFAKDVDTNGVTGHNPTGALSYNAVDPIIYHHAKVISDGTVTPSNTLRVRSLELTYDQPHDEERHYLGAQNPDEPLADDFLVPTWRVEQEYQSLELWNACRSFDVGSPRIIFRGGVMTTLTLGAIASNTTGTDQITRAAGSFTADGVKVGHLVTHTDFPPGTYVVTPGTTAMTVSNVSTGAGFSNVALTFTTDKELELRSNSAKLVDLSEPIESYGVLLSTATWQAYYDETDTSALVLRSRSQEGALA